MHTTPRPVYYLLVTTTTQLILAVAALLVLLPVGLLSDLPWNMVGFLLAYDVLIATFVGLLLTSRNAENKPVVLKGGGLVLGHLVGILLGGFVGMRYGGALGAIGGAVLLYFVIGWAGSRISLAIGHYLDRQAAPLPRIDGRSALLLARPVHSSVYGYGLLVPALFMVGAMLLKDAGVAVGQPLVFLHTARPALVILSVVSVLIPWLRRKGLLGRYTVSLSRSFMFSVTSFVLCMAPAVYGFLLFVGFGMSMAELSIFAVLASIAATTWGMSRTHR